MPKAWSPTYWVVFVALVLPIQRGLGIESTRLSLQEDGSLVVANAAGSISDFVKQGTPRQSIQIGAQSCNVSYGFSSSGKKTILLTPPPTASVPLVFQLAENQITVPPKSALRVTLENGNQIEKMDGNPVNTVQFLTLSGSTSSSPTASPAEPTQSSPVPDSSVLPSPEAVTRPSEPPSSPSLPNREETPSPTSSGDETSLAANGWPGKLLEAPIPESQMEDDQFYVRTEFGPRFVSSMNLVSVGGGNGNYGILSQKEIAFSTGYRQDIDLGVWLTDWFGLALETGFALNAVRGNTEGMTVSSTTYWTIPLLAQLCFQYPNESGWIPYINFGFGGGWTLLKVGSIDYTQPGGASIPLPLSGTGNAVTNAYQIAAGVRYRLYEELSISLAYKFYGNSQANINLANGVTATLGSPVTNSAELGVNFSF